MAAANYDIEDFIRTGLYRSNEPVGRGGTTPYSGEVGTYLADQQIKNQFTPALQKILDAQRRSFNARIMDPFAAARETAGSTGAGTSAFGTIGPLTTPGAFTSKPQFTNPEDAFRLLRIPKDPSGQFDKIRDESLKQIANFKPDFKDIQSYLQESNQRAISGAGRFSEEALANLAKVKDTTSASEADAKAFIDELARRSPQLMAETDAQSAALQRSFLPSTDPNSLSAELARSRDKASLAEQALTNRQIANAILGGQLRARQSGMGSVNAQNLAAQAAAVAEPAAIRRSQREIEDIRYLQAQQQANAGRSQELARQNLLANAQLPIAMRQQILQNALTGTGETQRQFMTNEAARSALLGQNVNLANLTDPLEVERRRTELANLALQNYLSSNFTNVIREGEMQPAYIPYMGRYPADTGTAPTGGYPGQFYDINQFSGGMYNTRPSEPNTWIEQFGEDWLSASNPSRGGRYIPSYLQGVPSYNPSRASRDFSVGATSPIEYNPNATDFNIEAWTKANPYENFPVPYPELAFNVGAPMPNVTQPPLLF